MTDGLGKVPVGQIVKPNQTATIVVNVYCSRCGREESLCACTRAGSCLAQIHVQVVGRP